jgi:hypothetical protein
MHCLNKRLFCFTSNQYKLNPYSHAAVSAGAGQLHNAFRKLFLGGDVVLKFEEQRAVQVFGSSEPVEDYRYQ